MANLGGWKHLARNASKQLNKKVIIAVSIKELVTQLNKNIHQLDFFINFLTLFIFCGGYVHILAPKNERYLITDEIANLKGSRNYQCLRLSQAYITFIKVLCNNCCGERYRLDYMEGKEGRVCTPCKTILERLDRVEREGASAPAATRPNPSNPMEYCSR